MKRKKVGRPAVDKKAKAAWQAVRRAKDVSRIAAAVGVSKAAVSKWPHVPKAHLYKVAALLDVKPANLRPDLPADPWASLATKGTTS